MKKQIVVGLVFTVGAVAAAISAEPVITGEASAPAQPLSLWYRHPAARWEEALPVGNGRLGAMIFGGVPQERIALNESSFWSGRPHDYDDTNAFQYFGQIRDLVFADRFQEAERMVNDHFYGKPKAQEAYQPIGDLVLSFDSTNFTDYRRELNMETGIAKVSYRSGGVVIMIYAIFPDIPDVDELRSRERREGTYSALTTFTRKLSSALAVFAVAQVLQFAGYIPPIEQGGKLVEAVQTPAFINALRLFFVLIPVGFISFGIFFASRFPLTRAIYLRLNSVLANMRANGKEDPAEREDLIKQLVG